MNNHSWSTSIALHLLPGMAIVVLYWLLAPVFNDMGYPSLMALGIAALLGIVPLELGHLLYQGYRLNGKWSFRGVIPPAEKMRPAVFAGWLALAMMILILIGGLTFMVESSIKTSFFSWLPDWYFYDTNFQSYPKEVLITTAWVRLGLDGFVFPITEELYFRGYLFPRLPGTVKSKWMWGALLFSVYHFWQPWNYISLFLISLVLVGGVAKFRNIYLSVAIHMLANILGSILFFGQVLQQAH